jgi:hypothetical protein
MKRDVPMSSPSSHFFILNVLYKRRNDSLITKDGNAPAQMHSLEHPTPEPALIARNLNDSQAA